MTLTRRSFLVSLGMANARAADPRPPNIVLIISDDHGWTDYGFMGHRDVRTPHLDRIAREGLTFTRGYVPSSLCRPSLASIMTGLYPHQHRITGNDPAGDARDPANRARMVKVFEQSKTIAGLLGERGYRSHQSGKWWEGQCQCGGFTECMTHGDVLRGGRHGDDGLAIGRETMQPVFDFIDRSQGSPFFLWYAPFLPHTPHNPPDRLLDRYRVRGLPLDVARYYAMIEWLDETVGALVQHLERRRLDRDTLLVYLADNGWVQGGGDLPFRGRAKLSPYDAGVRTPLLLRWPGRIAPRREERTAVSCVDLATTMLPACGVRPLAAMPGVNLLDARSVARRKAVFGSIFVHTSVDINRPAANLKYRWIVRGHWKLIAPYAPNRELELWERRGRPAWMKDEPELFDLAADPFEERDLAPRRPDQVRRLLAELDRWWTPA